MDKSPEAKTPIDVSSQSRFSETQAHTQRLNLLQRLRAKIKGPGNVTNSEEQTEPKIEFFKRYEWIEDEIVGRGKNWEKSLSRYVLQLHNGKNRHDENGTALPDTNEPPKLMFVPATSAVPYAMAVKECWTEAFPGEKPSPIFLLDVSDKKYQLAQLPAEAMEVIEAKQVDRLRQKGEALDAFSNSAVFDEWTRAGRTALRVADALRAAGFKDINFSVGGWGLHYPFGENQKPVVRGFDKQTQPKLVVQSTRETRQLVQDFKTLGRKMAQEIRIRNYKV